MAVGPKVSTYTLLVDKVELQGVVYDLEGSLQIGEALGARTTFDLGLDLQYQCLLAAVPGSNGFLHCTMTVPPASESNKPDPGGIVPMPAGTILSVQNRPSNTSLLVGDHVRISGRLWLVHDPQLGLMFEFGSDRRYSQTYLALQPFEWNKIEVIDDSSPQPGAVVEGSLALVVPLFQERYVEGWWPNQRDMRDGHVYVADDPNPRNRNYSNELTTTLTLMAPKLPSEFTPDSTLLSWQEVPMTNTTDQPVDQVRSITKTDSGIEVTASVSAQPSSGQPIADSNTPAAFCATYYVHWAPRLAAPDSVSVEGYENQRKPFTVQVNNRGPDDLKITQVTVDNDPEGAFVPSFGRSTGLVGRSNTNLSVDFAPKRAGSFDATLLISTDDPVGRPLNITLHGSSIALLKVGGVRIILRTDKENTSDHTTHYREVVFETPATYAVCIYPEKLDIIKVQLSTWVHPISVIDGETFIVKDPNGQPIAGRVVLPPAQTSGQPIVGPWIGWIPLSWDNQKFGIYSVTLVGDRSLSEGRPAIQSLEGRYLDGEPAAFPSGNGEEGGSFTFSFEMGGIF